MPGTNPLLDDRFIDFLLYDVLDVTALCESAERSYLDLQPGWLGPC